MRIHPEMPYQVTRHSRLKHFSKCDGERMSCPFDETAVNEKDFCKVCAWRKRGDS